MTQVAKKKVLVIGGSRGIGAAIVTSFADAGADVRFTFVSSEETATRLSEKTKSTPIRCDASDVRALRVAIRDAGAVDVLVYNAGLFTAGDPLTMADEDVDRMIEVNIRGPYYACVEAARAMPEGGRLIVIGSVNGDRVPFPGIAAYAMTKSAMQGMVRGLARDFGPRGITVNLVQPGPTDTDMNPADGPWAKQMHEIMATGRHGTAAEVASLVLYLAGDAASGITGAAHTIDGGFGA